MYIYINIYIYIYMYIYRLFTPKSPAKQADVGVGRYTFVAASEREGNDSSFV